MNIKHDLKRISCKNILLQRKKVFTTLQKKLTLK